MTWEYQVTRAKCCQYCSEYTSPDLGIGAMFGKCRLTNQETLPTEVCGKYIYRGESGNYYEGNYYE